MNYILQSLQSPAVKIRFGVEIYTHQILTIGENITVMNVQMGMKENTI